MYDNIVKKINKVIKENTPEAVLFSGGVDSSAILYHAHKINPDVMGITVGVEGKESSDIEYSTKVAEEMGIKNHRVYYVEEEKVKQMVETAVKVLKSFNPEWISSTTTLLLGTMYAKSQGLKSISSGEGADDLLGSFPFFTNWKGDMKSLDKAIKDRLQEIVVMSDVIAKNMGMEYIAPFQNDEVKKAILDIPIEERMKQENEIKTKYPLRKAYEGVLPQISITRPQTMAFTGSGVYDTIQSIGNDIDDKEYEQACKNIFKFKSKFEYALFKIYQKYYKFEKQPEGGGCVHCGSSMNGNIINCKVCATLQIDGKELIFNGEESKNTMVKGAESILIHNGNIVLGMQKPDRWYTLEDGSKAGIIKTIGGMIEKEDEESSRNAVQREMLEEIKGIEKSDIRLSTEPVFSKKVTLGQLNPYERDSDLVLDADFYIAEIIKEGKLEPNDLPALIEIPIDKFMKMNFGCSDYLRFIKDSVNKNSTLYQDIELPENYAIMAPGEVKNFFKSIMKNEGR